MSSGKCHEKTLCCRREVRDSVRRLTNHPSLALWAANNENEVALRSETCLLSFFFTFSLPMYVSITLCFYLYHSYYTFIHTVLFLNIFIYHLQFYSLIFLFFHNFREKFWNFKTKFKIFLTQIISKVDCVEFQSMKRRSWVILINYPPSLAIYLSSFLFPCPPCFPPLLCVLNTTSPSQIPHSLPNNLAQSFGVL